MPICRCHRCGLIFAPDAPAGGAPTCEHCLSRINRGKRRGAAFDPRDAALFRALARDRRSAADLRVMLGLPRRCCTDPPGRVRSGVGVGGPPLS